MAAGLMPVSAQQPDRRSGTTSQAAGPAAAAMAAAAAALTAAPGGHWRMHTLIIFNAYKVKKTWSCQVFFA